MDLSRGTYNIDLEIGVFAGRLEPSHEPRILRGAVSTLEGFQGASTHDVCILHELHILHEVGDKPGSLLGGKSSLLYSDDSLNRLAFFIRVRKRAQEGQTVRDGICEEQAMSGAALRWQAGPLTFVEYALELKQPERVDTFEYYVDHVQVPGGVSSALYSRSCR